MANYRNCECSRPATEVYGNTFICKYCWDAQHKLSSKERYGHRGYGAGQVTPAEDLNNGQRSRYIGRSSANAKYCEHTYVVH